MVLVPTELTNTSESSELTTLWCKPESNSKFKGTFGSLYLYNQMNDMNDMKELLEYLDRVKDFCIHEPILALLLFLIGFNIGFYVL